MKSSRIVYISIETTAYSGATLLALQLGAQTEITTIGEISGLVESDNPDEYICSCGKLIKVCDFWQSVDKAMARKGFSFDFANFDTKFDFDGSAMLRRFRLGSFRNYLLDAIHDSILFSLPIERMRFQKAVDRNVAFIEAIMDISDKKMIIDSSKSRLRVRALRHFSDMEVRVIHLVRRVEGVVYSQLRRDPDSDIASLARDWERRHRRLLVNYGIWGEDKYTLVRYEDICENTEETLKRLLNFLHVKTDKPCMDFQDSDQHVIGNPMRLQPLREIELDTKWKDRLTSEQLITIEKIAGKMNRQFGYS